MKGYKKFVIIFLVLLVGYIGLEMTRPKPIDWNETLSMRDKIPYGTYCVYSQLKDIFPHAVIQPFRSPAYNQVNNSHRTRSAYLMVDPDLSGLSRDDIRELLHYTAAGNYLFLCASDMNRVLKDTLRFATDERMDYAREDSTTINFAEPALRSRRDYGFKRLTLTGYFKKYDTLKTKVLGVNQRKEVNFISMRYGKGTIFIHLLPLTFSNFFLVTRNNAEYTARVLSHIPAGVDYIYWDEYYKPGKADPSSPLRFLLTDEYLRWTLWIGLIAMLLYVLFGIKRRQRMIPVIEPLQNTTLDFVKTLGNVYFNRQDNRNIADKMILYLLEQIRSRFFLSTADLDAGFAEALARKSGVSREQVDELLKMITVVQSSPSISSQELLELNRRVDRFYEAAG